MPFSLLDYIPESESNAVYEPPIKRIVSFVFLVCAFGDGIYAAMYVLNFDDYAPLVLAVNLFGAAMFTVGYFISLKCSYRTSIIMLITIFLSFHLLQELFTSRVEGLQVMLLLILPCGFLFFREELSETHYIYLCIGIGICCVLLVYFDDYIIFPSMSRSPEHSIVLSHVVVTSAFLSITYIFDKYAQSLLSLESQLRRAANEDYLTGALTRRALFEQANMQLSTSDNSASTIGVVLFDLDNFKKFNDSYGHFAGDQLLTLIGEGVNNVLKEGDLFARFGGEEFVIVTINAHRDTFCCFAQDIFTTVNEISLRIDNQVITPQLSLGCAIGYTRESSLEAIIKKADRALYHAKSNGKRQCAFDFSDVTPPGTRTS